MSADANTFPAHRATIAGMLVAMVATLVFHFTPAREALGAAALDAQFRFLRTLHAVQLDNDVVVVGIDDETFKRFSEPVAAALGSTETLVALGEQSIKGRAAVTVLGWSGQGCVSNMGSPGRRRCSTVSLRAYDDRVSDLAGDKRT